MPDVEGYKHGATRANLPTDGTEPFMDEADKAPVRYVPPIRDRSGPVLSWDRGENLDETATDATPLYINEKIHPSAFIAQLQSLDPAPMFGDFNNLPKDAAYEWYQHEGNWSNRLIRGDSVKVMASLLAKEGMEGKVQMIYMDPPYGIGFKSNIQIATDNRNTPDNAKALPHDPTFIQTFRDRYSNGLHSYLDNLYRNFTHARALLSESGSIFVQIGSENVNRVALVLDEVFGQENRVAQITFAKSSGTSSITMSEIADHILWYARDRDHVTARRLFDELSRRERLELMSSYAMLEIEDGTARQLTREERDDLRRVPEGARLFQRADLTSQGISATGRSDPYIWNDTSYECPSGRHWAVSHQGIDRLVTLNRVVPTTAGSLNFKLYENEIPGRSVSNLWSNQTRPNDPKYVVETGPQVVARCILMATDPGDIVMDVTCGGGTTAYVAEQWGRRWITTDTSGVPLAIARQRLLSAVYDWYHLQDSKEGALEEAQLSGKPPANVSGEGSRDPAKGFVYKRVPRVSAAILAYDQEVDPILLVNQPLVKRGVVRVASPFTVESHSPWRYVAPDQVTAPQEDQLDTRQRMVDAIQVSGIRAGDDRLMIEDVADWGEVALVTHTAVSIDAEGLRTPCAIAIVPDDQTASEEFIELAAEQAAERRRLRRLIVIAFNYDASVHTGSVQRGRLEILKVQANRDFQIPGLENKETDHAFVMIGQPEVLVHDEGNGNISVEVLGFDTYNPATGSVERGEAKDIDCWMVDTDYNGQSFYARRIHLPNSSNDKRFNRLRRRLGKRVDPDLWESMQSTRSAPFRRPAREHARIAVRIITRTDIEMTVELDVKPLAAL